MRKAFVGSTAKPTTCGAILALSLGLGGAGHAQESTLSSSAGYASHPQLLFLADRFAAAEHHRLRGRWLGDAANRLVLRHVGATGDLSAPFWAPSDNLNTVNGSDLLLNNGYASSVVGEAWASAR